MIPFRFFPYQYREPKPSVSLDGLSLSGHQYGFDAGLSNSATKGWAGQCRQKELEICLHIVYHAQTPLSFADCHKDSNNGRLQAAADRRTCNKRKSARNRDSNLRLNPIVTPCKLKSKLTEDPTIAMPIQPGYKPIVQLVLLIVTACFSIRTQLFRSNNLNFLKIQSYSLPLHEQGLKRLYIHP